jgi:hypothetical protein
VTSLTDLTNVASRLLEGLSRWSNLFSAEKNDTHRFYYTSEIFESNMQ